MDYEQFKDEWKTACRERHACTKGYQQLLSSKSVSDILATAVANWTDVYKSKFADFMAANIVRQFEGLKDEFHAAGFFVNENSDKGICVVCRPDRPLEFDGRARVYIFDQAEVTARGMARVYCRNKNSVVRLYDNAYGKIEAGRVWAYDFSTVDSHEECWCHDRTIVTISGGVVHDEGHRRMTILNEKEMVAIQSQYGTREPKV